MPDSRFYYSMTGHIKEPSHPYIMNSSRKSEYTSLIKIVYL